MSVLRRKATSVGRSSQIVADHPTAGEHLQRTKQDGRVLGVQVLRRLSLGGAQIHDRPADGGLAGPIDPHDMDDRGHHTRTGSDSAPYSVSNRRAMMSQSS